MDRHKNKFTHQILMKILNTVFTKRHSGNTRHNLQFSSYYSTLCKLSTISDGVKQAKLLSIHASAVFFQQSSSELSFSHASRHNQSAYFCRRYRFISCRTVWNMLNYYLYVSGWALDRGCMAEPASYCVTLSVDSTNKRPLGAWFLSH